MATTSLVRSAFKIGKSLLGALSKNRAALHTAAVNVSKGADVFGVTKATPMILGTSPGRIFTKGVAAATKTDTRAVLTGTALIAGGTAAAVHQAKKMDW